jgi:hypothetical protein
MSIRQGYYQVLTNYTHIETTIFVIIFNLLGLLKPLYILLNTQ